VSIHRFFLPAELLQTEEVRFPADQSRQIRTVLRLREGDELIALDGKGFEFLVRLKRVGERAVGTVESRMVNQSEPSTSLTLCQGVLKAAKFELLLQKCTEIGVTRFVPVVTERCVTSDPGAMKQRRYQTIVREAAEQSRRGLLPVVAPALSFMAAFEDATARGPVVVLWEDERAAGISELPPALPTGAVTLFVGPEGGFTASEVTAAREAGGQIVSLGHRILRAETAAIVGSALLLARLGDLG